MSCDVFLGLPYNIASYALLTHMIAQQCDLKVKKLVWIGGDVHIYKNHIEQVKEQLIRLPYKLPKLELNKADSIFDYKLNDIEVYDYQCHPSIKAQISI